jgi:hypothetical protein
MRGALVQGRHRLRHIAEGRRNKPVVNRRPDGTPVAPALEIRQTAPAMGGLIGRLTAPVRAVETAVRERWDDAVREAKLAAKEKETDMRANYERRVHHDARVHAEQHSARRPRRDGG